MTDAESFTAWTAWTAVSDEERQEVARLARQGREHPDERVAAAARGWAEVLLVDDVHWREDRWWRRFFVIPGFLYLAEVGFTEWLEHRAEQAWARRVLRAKGPLRE